LALGVGTRSDAHVVHHVGEAHRDELRHNLVGRDLADREPRCWDSEADTGKREE
jgi:hypothetical protein